MERSNGPSPKGRAQLDGEASELQFVIDNMRQGLWRLNSFGVIRYANPYLAEWLETTPEEMVNRHFSKYRSLRLVGDRDVEASLSQRYEAEFITKSGVVRRGIVVTSPTVGPDGSPSGTIDLITDITAEHAVHTRLVQEVQQMSHLASTDPLTKVANRHVFESVLRTLIDNAATDPFGLVIIDLDGFKEINDIHGHDSGDSVLEEVATRIKSGVRDNDVVARFGGDEFAVLVPNAGRAALEEVVERLRERLHFKMPGNGTLVDVMVSIGSAHSDDEVHAIVRAADQEMYRRKHLRKARLA